MIDFFVTRRRFLCGKVAQHSWPETGPRCVTIFRVCEGILVYRGTRLGACARNLAPLCGAIFNKKNEVIGSKKTRTKHHNRPPNSTIVSSGECRNEVGVEGIIR